MFLAICHDELMLVLEPNSCNERWSPLTPGITGYTQAYYRNNLSVREKRLKDAWYAQNVTFWLDVKIFFKTFATVLSSREVYTNEAGTSKDELYIDNSNEAVEEVAGK